MTEASISASKHPVPELNRLENKSVPAAMLMILEHVQRLVNSSKDTLSLRQVVQRLQGLLDQLPDRENIMEEFSDEEIPLDVRRHRISRRLWELSQHLRQQSGEAVIEKEVGEDEENIETNEIIDGFVAEQRALFVKEEILKSEQNDGKNVSQELGQIRNQIQEVGKKWREAVKKIRQESLPEEKKTELEQRLTKIFEADPEVKPPMTAEEKSARDQAKEQEVEEWLKKLNPQGVQLVMEAAVQSSKRKRMKKEDLYRFRQQTHMVVQQAKDTVQEIRERNKYFDEKIRERVRERMGLFLQEKKVPEFLETSYAVTAECVLDFDSLETDHPLFILGQKILELRNNLPTPEQITHSGFTRDQMMQVRKEIECCLSELVDPDEKLKVLQNEISRKAMNPRKGPAKSNLERSREQWNEQRNEFERKKKKGGWRGRNKW